MTDVSGRGVGMDVVKRNVEALRGQIDIISAEGKGSTFTIRLPLTLAVIDGLVVQGRRRALHHPDHQHRAEPSAAGQADFDRAEPRRDVHGAREPAAARASAPPVQREADNEDPTKALRGDRAGRHQRRCCLLVDELLGQQQVVIKSLGEGLGQIKGISGGAILGDGNVSLILDVPGLLAAAAGRLKIENESARDKD